MIRNQVIRWGIAIGYTLFLLGYLLQPPGAPTVEVVAPLAAPDWQREIAFTVGHIIGFGALFSIWYVALLRPVGVRATLGAWVLALMIGVLAEILQSLLPERNASGYDLAMNAIGISLAWVGMSWWRRRISLVQRS